MIWFPELVKIDSSCVVAYRPERRAVIRVRGRDQSGTPKCYFIKIVREKHHRRLHRLFRAIAPEGVAPGLMTPLRESRKCERFRFRSRRWDLTS